MSARMSEARLQEIVAKVGDPDESRAFRLGRCESHVLELVEEVLALRSERDRMIEELADANREVEA